MNISISKSGKKEVVVAELRAEHDAQRQLAHALATYIDSHAIPDTDVTVSISGSVTLVPHPE